MICDKCEGEVEPQNNAVLYDAALSALIEDRLVLEHVSEHRDIVSGEVSRMPCYRHGYHPQTIFLMALDLFLPGDIVHGDPVQSVRNVMERHRKGRHLYETGSCEGSPSRRRSIAGESDWVRDDSTGQFAEFTRQAYEIVKSLETPALSPK
jgi:hypothetical protein